MSCLRRRLSKVRSCGPEPCSILERSMEVVEGRKGSFPVLSCPVLCGRLKESVKKSPKRNYFL